MPMFVGTSNIVLTNGGAPTALTVNSLSVVGDLLLFFHYSNVDGTTETVTAPTGFTEVINERQQNFGLICLAWRIRQAGDQRYRGGAVHLGVLNDNGADFCNRVESGSAERRGAGVRRPAGKHHF
jgi:hypothetical protein